MRTCVRMARIASLGPCHGSWCGGRRRQHPRTVRLLAVCAALCSAGLLLSPTRLPVWVAEDGLDGREALARRLWAETSNALSNSGITHTVGGPTLFNCLMFQNLTSPTAPSTTLHIDVVVPFGSDWGFARAAMSQLRQSGLEWSWEKVSGDEHCGNVSVLSSRKLTTVPPQETLWWHTVFRNGTQLDGYLTPGAEMPLPAGIGLDRTTSVSDLVVACSSNPSCAAVTFAWDNQQRIVPGFIHFKRDSSRLVRGVYTHTLAIPTPKATCAPRHNLVLIAKVRNQSTARNTVVAWNIVVRTLAWSDDIAAIPDPDESGYDTAIVPSGWLLPIEPRRCGEQLLPTPRLSRSLLSKIYGNLGECPAAIGGHEPCINLVRARRPAYWSSGAGGKATVRIEGGRSELCPADDAAVPLQHHHVWIRWGRKRSNEPPPLATTAACRAVFKKENGWKHNFWMLPSIPIDLELMKWVRLLLTHGSLETAEVLLWLELLRAFGGVASRANRSCTGSEFSTAYPSGVAVAAFDGSRRLISLSAPRMHWGLHQTINELVQIAAQNDSLSAQMVDAHVSQAVRSLPDTIYRTLEV
eukprot:m.19144 g.19144  ORF g.19144 m.19144 type:complete len:581 (+) comp5402_c0_seq1:348-2090(+)